MLRYYERIRGNVREPAARSITAEQQGQRQSNRSYDLDPGLVG